MARTRKKSLYLMLIWSFSCAGFSSTYFYQLYLHSEYYAEPPGFPRRIIGVPMFSFFKGKGNDWHENRFSATMVEALRLSHNHTWIELIAGFGKESVKYNHEGKVGKQSRFGGDDFLIDIGHNFIDASGKKQILVHWLTGIPLHRKVTLADVEQPLLGNRTMATGPVIEFAYDFMRTVKNDLFIGLINRFLHWFKRPYEPILPPGAFYKPGNSLDVFFLIHYRYYGHNFEVGYIPTFYFDSSYQFPNQSEQLPSQIYNSVYVDYFYFVQSLSMGLELNVTETFGKPYEGTIIFGSVSWYF